jgi:hypothetical protein
MTDVCFLCERNPITWPGTGMCEQCHQETADMEHQAEVDTGRRAHLIPDLLVRVMRGRVGALRLERGHWRADCPWCDEDGELCQSLFVYPQNFYHCFACGAHGDAISFLMWAEDLRFMQAIEWLAKENGIELGKGS